jgi:hypothetical protein
MKLAITGMMALGLASLLMVSPGRAQVSSPDGSGVSSAVYSTDAPEDVTYFYADLSPYGSWVNLEGYGWCWQPAQVAGNPQWQPYCDDGHWVYTDAGWFWQSDYAWGWAPFHYGRWLRHDRVGWVWFPDRVWGPAWVTWREAGNECGWAPLPLHSVFDANAGFYYNGVNVGANFDFGLPMDCYTFVAMGDFCAADVGHHRLGQPEVARVYDRTTVINDYRFDHQTVVNRGIPVDRIAAVTHADLRPIPVRDEPARAGVREADKGPASGVYRRTLSSPDKNVALQAQNVDERHPVIQHRALLPAGAAFQPTPENNVRGPASPNAPARTVQPSPAEPVQIGDADFDPSRGDEAIEPGGKIIPPIPRSQRVANEAHALPPLFRPHDEPAPEEPSKPLVFVPRSQQVANQAHALPPLKEKAPPVELAQPKPSNSDAVSTPRDKTRLQH